MGPEEPIQDTSIKPGGESGLSKARRGTQVTLVLVVVGIIVVVLGAGVIWAIGSKIEQYGVLGAVLFIGFMVFAYAASQK